MSLPDFIQPRDGLATLIDGKRAAEALDAAVAVEAAALASRIGRKPCLAVVLVGDDPASHVYVRNKVRRTEAAGMISQEFRRPADMDEADLIALVETLNADPDVDGILVQMPLPGHMDARRVVETIHPSKDVDGLTAVSAGRLVLGSDGLRPCTPSGCVWLAKKALGDLSGLHVVVIGRSILVGKPAALLFLEQNCTVTIAHSRTRDLANMCRSADILVAAAGRAGMVQADWIKPGACVLDVGINRTDGGLTGDVAFEASEKMAGYITPVPGGIGPMTIAVLLANTLKAAAGRTGEKISDPLAG